MHTFFSLIIDKKWITVPEFQQGNSILIDFTQNLNRKEYRFVYRNANKYSTIKFKFLSELTVDCYYELIGNDGKRRIYGYDHLKDEEKVINISNCSQFSVIIPREHNSDVHASLKLVSLSVE